VSSIKQQKKAIKKDTAVRAVSSPLSGFAVNHYFNKFRVIPNPEGVVVHVMFQDQYGGTMSPFSFFLPQETLDREAERLLSYVDAIDFADSEMIENFVGSPVLNSSSNIHAVRIMHAGRTGTHAELLLYNMTVSQQIHPDGDESKIKADQIAALSSPLSVHTMLIKTIFSKPE
jgi:hypothetical protein